MAIYGRGLHVPAGSTVDADAYDGYIGRWSRLFVPALLEAADVANAERALDVATGSGEAAIAALSLLGGIGFVTGVDIAPAMLEAARLRLVCEQFLPVAADGGALPFADATFDAVICQLGLQFFPDPVRGLSEMRRVLRPGRRVAVCVIGTAQRAPMWGVLADAISRALPEQRDALHLSFALADGERLAHLFERARFGDIQVRRETRGMVIDSFDDYWAPIEAGIGMMPQAYRSLPEAQRRVVREEVREGLETFTVAGKLALSVEMLIAAGRA